MFDLSTVPDINLKEMSYKDIDIVSFYGPNTFYLLNKGIMWMGLNKNTNKQIKEFYSQYDLAYGDVLLTGFGFGILASWLASKPEVTSVTVVEISQDIVDVFLQNNTLNEKIKVIIADASEYKTDQHFDCLFLDHYEIQYEGWVLNDMKNVSKNIPNHTVFWAWSIENRLCWPGDNPSREDMLHGKILDHASVDFYPLYNKFKNLIVNIPTLPYLDSKKINEYVYTYFDKIDRLK